MQEQVDKKLVGKLLQYIAKRPNITGKLAYRTFSNFCPNASEAYLVGDEVAQIIHQFKRMHPHYEPRWFAVIRWAIVYEVEEDGLIRWYDERRYVVANKNQDIKYHRDWVGKLGPFCPVGALDIEVFNHVGGDCYEQEVRDYFKLPKETKIQDGTILKYELLFHCDIPEEKPKAINEVKVDRRYKKIEPTFLQRLMGNKNTKMSQEQINEKVMNMLRKRFEGRLFEYEGMYPVRIVRIRNYDPNEGHLDIDTIGRHSDIHSSTMELITNAIAKCGLGIDPDKIWFHHKRDRDNVYRNEDGNLQEQEDKEKKLLDFALKQLLKRTYTIEFEVDIEHRYYEDWDDENDAPGEGHNADVEQFLNLDVKPVEVELVYKNDYGYAISICFEDAEVDEMIYGLADFNIQGTAQEQAKRLLTAAGVGHLIQEISINQAGWFTYDEDYTSIKKLTHHDLHEQVGNNEELMLGKLRKMYLGKFIKAEALQVAYVQVVDIGMYEDVLTFFYRYAEKPRAEKVHPDVLRKVTQYFNRRPQFIWVGARAYKNYRKAEKNFEDWDFDNLQEQVEKPSIEIPEKMKELIHNKIVGNDIRFNDGAVDHWIKIRGVEYFDSHIPLVWIEWVGPLYSEKTQQEGYKLVQKHFKRYTGLDVNVIMA